MYMNTTEHASAVEAAHTPVSLKLALGPTIEVPVKFDVQDAGRLQTHSFRLTCRRESQERIAALSAAGGSAVAFMAEVTTDWQGQRLVLVDDTQQPASFTAEALDLLFSLPGLASVAFSSYLTAVGATAKS